MFYKFIKREKGCKDISDLEECICALEKGSILKKNEGVYVRVGPHFQDDETIEVPLSAFKDLNKRKCREYGNEFYLTKIKRDFLGNYTLITTPKEYENVTIRTNFEKRDSRRIGVYSRIMDLGSAYIPENDCD